MTCTPFLCKGRTL